MVASGELYSKARGGPARPLVLCPEVEMHTDNRSPEAMKFFMQSAYMKYSPTEIERLQSDEVKRERFCEVHAECIVPCYHQVHPRGLRYLIPRPQWPILVVRIWCSLWLTRIHVWLTLSTRASNPWAAPGRRHLRPCEAPARGRWHARTPAGHDVRSQRRGR